MLEGLKHYLDPNPSAEHATAKKRATASYNHYNYLYPADSSYEPKSLFLKDQHTP